MQIAVDAMGGEQAPHAIVEGAVMAARNHGAKVILVGNEERVLGELEKHDTSGLSLSVYHAPHVVGMHESPSVAVRQNRDSSIKVALGLVKEGEADAVVSAGNSGAAMAFAMFILKKLEGVERPAIATFHPTAEGMSILLDAGGNVDCKPIHLIQFAIMGSVYAKLLLGKQSPRIGLLSNGTEEGKGNELTRETHAILKQTRLNYAGYVEGRDICNGNADVIVCDGFVGNVALKTSEGLAEVVGAILKSEIKKSLRAKLGYLLLKGAFANVEKRVDYSEYGGAPLLGINGICLICHGSSSAKAIKNAVLLGQKLAQGGFNQDLVDELGKRRELLKVGGKNVMKILDQIKEKIIH
ncbi:MAG: phosphate acyltransferase PlsX [Thermodesulfobacteriota bacterium]